MKLARAIAYDEKLKKIIETNLNNPDISIHKKFEIRRKCESANSGYLKKTYNTTINLMNMYKEFITNIDKYSDHKDIATLKKYTLENLRAKRITHDDLACILYLLYKTQPAPYYNSMKCVLIDEAQDLSELMYMALRGVFNNATFGIFGDIAQGIYAYQSIDSWRQVLDILDEPEMLYLKKCYRTSIEIMEEANKTLALLGTPPAQNVLRHGEPVDNIDGNSIVDIDRAIRYCNEQYSHTAIICKDDAELKGAQDELAELNLVVIDEHNISYDNNQNVLLTVQTAKGLEFDSVIIYNKGGFREDSVVDLRLLYVAQTRALHKLIQCGVNNKNKY
jgi:DNA helicase-2/ATP-dependent DNA helicase PcrA